MKTGIIDVGSNTMRVCVYEIAPDGSFEQLFSEKEMAGLTNYVTDRKLTVEGMERAADVLLSFKRLLSQFGVSDVHVFATASLRNIDNKEDSIRYLKSATGLNVAVVSGKTEAALAYYGSKQLMGFDNGAVFDIGGGSTEVARISDGKIQEAFSMPVGSLGLYRAYVSSIWPKKKELDEIIMSVRMRLDDVRSAHPSMEWGRIDDICGVGGTARSVLDIANRLMDRPRDERRLNAAELAKTVSFILKRSAQAKDIILKVCPDRIHTLIPGAVLMNELCTLLGCARLFISPNGVREGYVHLITARQ